MENTQTMTSLWSKDDPGRLFKLAQEIESNGSWKGYLSIGEHKLFASAIEKGESTWQKFISGKTISQIKKISPVGGSSEVAEDSDPHHDASSAVGFGDYYSNTNHTNSSSIFDSSGSFMKSHNPSQNPSKDKDEEVIVPVDPITIALRVRYMLYVKSLPLLFPSAADMGLNLEVSPGVFESDDGTTEQKEKKDTIRDEEEDYDDDDDNNDDEDEESAEGQNTTQNSSGGGDQDADVSMSENNSNNNANSHDIDQDDTYPLLEVTINEAEEGNDPDFKESREAVIHNYNKLYHTFENDRENALRQRRLDESDRLVDFDMMDENVSEKTRSGKNSASFGAANLSLKYLLATIEAKRDSLSLSDFELRNLISDVRKNRSKWASEDKIGQEELYEAAEKVVLELRGYTEHSTAFLNKVSKRDAPNYFNVIKHPMDLTTVMKKLKSFQYKSKKEFVADLMLIWRNCLTYNTDPKHFLRAHAIAMQKKTLTLTPLIPDITVRDRAEVEAEEAKAAAQENDNGDEEDDETRQGQNQSRMGMGKGGKHATKGRKRKLDDVEEGEDSVMADESQTTAGTDTQPKSSEGTPVPAPVLADGTVAANPVIAAIVATEQSKSGTSPGTPRSSSVAEMDGETSIMQTEETIAAEQESNPPESEDFESHIWQEVFTKQRAEYCVKRSDLFKDDKLQPETPAILRKPTSMAKFIDTTKHTFQRAEDSGRKRDRIFQGRSLLESLDDERKHFILEYEVGSGVPSEPPMAFDAIEGHPGEDDLGFTKYSAYRQEMANISEVPESEYIIHGGLTEVYDENLKTIQDIRKICSKIALVRQMQQQSLIHPNDLYHPDDIVNSDLDIESRLPDRDKFNGDASLQAMRRVVSKISMHSGFEVTELSSVDTLAEIACDYLSKLGRNLAMNLKQTNSSAVPKEKMVLNTLQEQGIESLGSLEIYVRENVHRHGTKLKDLQKKLASFLADLLRPGVQELTDREFTDGSEQFLNGDFSQQIGDDFFGFRELGLDKELGILGASVPFHLLQSKLSSSLSTQSDLPIHKGFIKQVPEYPHIDKNLAKRQIAILQPFYFAQLETPSAVTTIPRHTDHKAKVNVNVNGNGTTDGAVPPSAEGNTNGTEVNASNGQAETYTEVVLLELDQLPPKQRNIRGKLPPNGKITGTKKKLISKCFFIPVEPEIPVEVKLAPTENDTSMKDVTTTDNIQTEDNFLDDATLESNFLRELETSLEPSFDQDTQNSVNSLF